MQLANGIYYSMCSLKAQHVSSGTDTRDYLINNNRHDTQASSHSDLTTGGHHMRM